MNKRKIKKYLYKTFKEWRLTIFFILFIVIPVKSSLADWNWVPTGSMNPTILEGDLVYVNKLAYGLRFPLTQYRIAQWADPQRGDIVICFSPDDNTRLVKRVIGLPGDTIEMKNNQLFINGRAVFYTNLDPEFAAQLTHQEQQNCIFALEELTGLTHPVMLTPSVPARRDFGPVTVPENHYFVLGDNRDNSRDSRFFGFVHRQSIVGKTQAVIFSFDITDKYQPRLNRFFRAIK
ncbi:signal peptidase I [Planctomycetota bacterium]